VEVMQDYCAVATCRHSRHWEPASYIYMVALKRIRLRTLFENKTQIIIKLWLLRAKLYSILAAM
jgi:hypothetical protein